MKKFFTIAFILSITAGTASAQTEPAAPAPEVRPQALGFSFFFNDFKTAERIRTGSLSSVLRDKRAAKMNEMSPGLAVTYFKGLRSHIDFAATLAGSYTEGVVASQEPNDNGFLLEGDASFNFKMVDERYWLIPYLSAGIGFSKWKGYYGATMPLGAGLRLNLFNEAHLFVNTQYRIPVTTATTNYHFFHSIGIAGALGK
ncbi:MAG TPA: hypothetical protein VHK69_18925 [Chitinophagaceae bacterium]|jgi:hypothetical protein|nr:hypothetical protein [Chitinophagaceae bacterium]